MGKGAMDEPDAGLRDLNHCMQLIHAICASLYVVLSDAQLLILTMRPD